MLARTIHTTSGFRLAFTRFTSGSLQLKTFKRINPRRWRENERILHRIRSLHQKAKRITEDARKVGKWVVEVAEDFGANVIK
ncbi:381aa long conserved hypothetical protein [Sulfuracidifex tepidarius]|uniref:Uncharacterized protein n=1 Tax=Sulfuracidifex tepidarius TaxID=1294262 RepID=A0A510E683_9CREN|nr:381aa long conserved hypothetical protein [Sulfuracidifex tepidarius]